MISRIRLDQAVRALLDDLQVDERSTERFKATAPRDGTILFIEHCWRGIRYIFMPYPACWKLWHEAGFFDTIDLPDDYRGVVNALADILPTWMRRDVDAHRAAIGQPKEGSEPSTNKEEQLTRDRIERLLADDEVV